MEMDFGKTITNVSLMSTSLLRFDSSTKYMTSHNHVLSLVLFSVIDKVSVKLFLSFFKKNIHYDVVFTMTFDRDFQLGYCYSLKMYS